MNNYPFDLSFYQLSAINAKRCEAAFHPINAWSTAEWAVAAAGEMGEVCDAVKKLRRIQDGTNTAKDPQSREEAVGQIAYEIADTIIYLDLLATSLGIDVQEAIIRKFNIVSDRMKSDIKL